MDDGLDLNDLPGEPARRGPGKVVRSKPNKRQHRIVPIHHRPAQHYVDVPDIHGQHFHQNGQRNRPQNVSFDYGDFLTRLMVVAAVLIVSSFVVVTGFIVLSIVLEIVQFIFDVIETIFNVVLEVVNFILDVINAFVEAISFVVNLVVSIVTFIFDTIEFLFWITVAIITLPFRIIYSILMYANSVVLWFLGFFS